MDRGITSAWSGTTIGVAYQPGSASSNIPAYFDLRDVPSPVIGITYEWHGIGEVGAGRMEIKESLPPNRVTIDLHFLEPIDSRSVMLMQIEPAGSDSSVIWTMRGANTFLSKVMSVFTSMDAMVGPDFDRGLAQLQAAAK